jgi:hypothetical protein
MADLIASAVSTTKRPEFGPCPDGTAERMATLAAAAEADLADRKVHDALCDKVLTLGAFVMHCAWVEHTLAHITALPYVVPEQAEADDVEDRLRDLGRQGESKTAASR